MDTMKRREIEDRVVLRISKFYRTGNVIANVQRETSLNPVERLIWGIIFRAYLDAIVCYFSKKEVARHTLPPANLNELRRYFRGDEYTWVANAVGLNLTGERMLEEAKKRADELEKKCLIEIEKEIEKELANEEENL